MPPRQLLLTHGAVLRRYADHSEGIDHVVVGASIRLYDMADVCCSAVKVVRVAFPGASREVTGLGTCQISHTAVGMRIFETWRFTNAIFHTLAQGAVKITKGTVAVARGIGNPWGHTEIVVRAVEVVRDGSVVKSIVLGAFWFTGTAFPYVRLTQVAVKKRSVSWTFVGVGGVTALVVGGAVTGVGRMAHNGLVTTEGTPLAGRGTDVTFRQAGLGDGVEVLTSLALEGVRAPARGTEAPVVLVAVHRVVSQVIRGRPEVIAGHMTRGEGRDAADHQHLQESQLLGIFSFPFWRL